MKIIEALENYNILIKKVTKTIKNETKEQKGGFWSMLLDTLQTTLLGNFFTWICIIRACSGNKKGKGIARPRTGKQWDFSYRL